MEICNSRSGQNNKKTAAHQPKQEGATLTKWLTKNRKNINRMPYCEDSKYFEPEKLDFMLTWCNEWVLSNNRKTAKSLVEFSAAV
jgi:hypothetical protein